jgi:EAL domain-containing protein (putative c-di-GMP-specific phosphodiesterase class I)
VPLTWEGRIVGLLVAGSSSTASQQEGTGWLGSLAEYGAVASALLGHDLVLRRDAARTRASVLQLIAERQYRPVFQPIVDLASGRVVGFEALTRFADGLSPEIWFRRAAEIGLGLELQEACLRAALKEAGGLGPGWLSVNLSPGHIGGWEWLAGYVRDRPLVIEVTEDEAVDDYQGLRDRLAAVRASVDLAVDDAGAGFASLRHIIELRPQFVKLAMHIVRGVDTDPVRQAMVTGMVHFARQTGCQLIAEGIETDAERISLAALGVHLGQGYLLGRPARAVELAVAA